MHTSILELFFIVLVGVMNVIVETNRNNNYKLSHFGKLHTIYVTNFFPLTILTSSAVVPYHSLKFFLFINNGGNNHN